MAFVSHVQRGDAYEYNTIYNMTDNTFEPFYIRELAFCGANTLLPDGRALIAGGMPPLTSIPSAGLPVQSLSYS